MPSHSTVPKVMHIFCHVCNLKPFFLVYDDRGDALLSVSDLQFKSLVWFPLDKTAIIMSLIVRVQKKLPEKH